MNHSGMSYPEVFFIPLHLKRSPETKSVSTGAF